MTLFISIFFSFLLAAFTPWIYRRLGHRSAYFLMVYPFFIFGLLVSYLPSILNNETIQWFQPWVNQLNVNISFRLDGLGMIMSMLISGIGAMVILYGGTYLKKDPDQGKFFTLILVFMGAMLGVVTSDNALFLFVFWELTSISSFFLIGYKYSYERSRAAAWQALLVTGFGGLVMLAGLVLTGIIHGGFELSQWVVNADQIQSHPWANFALILILIGAMTKSAQFPFHFWLPNAMEAPSPVSAYLHSATMVKAGVFLIARLLPVFGGLVLWKNLVPWIGLTTMIFGALLALGQSDLKRLLAYTTISALGGLFFFFGVGSVLAVKTGILFLITHALYKGALFLVAGAIDHAASTRDVRILGALRKHMPFTALAGGFAALSMAGIAPFIGFIAKELFYETTLAADYVPYLITGLAVIANLANVAVAGWTGIAPFWRKGNMVEDIHHEEPGLWIPTLMLALAGFGLGIFADFSGKQLVTPVVKGLVDLAAEAKLSLWHGFTPMLWLSMVTLILGFILYYSLPFVREKIEKVLLKIGQIGPDRIYQKSLSSLLKFAAWETKLLHSGYLRFYVMLIILTTLGLASITYVMRLLGVLQLRWDQPRFYDLVFIAIIIFAALFVSRAKSRLATIALLGSIGFSIAILFLMYSAPDLAMVQFSIETLTVILFVLIIYRLPKFSREAGRPTQITDVIVSFAGGILMTFLMLLVSMHSNESVLSSYFATNSYSLANGRNMVNVILVDFRGLDTLGEISVLAIAAVGVFALVKLTVKNDPANKT